MKLKIVRILIFAFIYIGVLIAQVNTESMRKENAAEGFENTLGFEFGFEKSDQEVMEIVGEYRIDYYSSGGLHTFLILNYENGYEKESSEKNTIVNKGFGHLRMTKNISSNLYIELFSQFGFNDFLLMKDRKLYGSGLRYKVIGNDKLNAFVGIGAMKEDEKYSLETENYKSLYRSTNYIRWQISLSDNATLNNTAYYQLDTSKPKDHRILYDGDFEFELNEKLTFTFTLNYRYDNDPHGTLGKTYIQVGNGIEFSF
tara:strand:- start:2377 stop:3147 length:771 start_codon:yes stop_codon:yes gene_type:complete